MLKIATELALINHVQSADSDEVVVV